MFEFPCIKCRRYKTNLCSGAIMANLKQSILRLTLMLFVSSTPSNFKKPQLIEIYANIGPLELYIFLEAQGFRTFPKEIWL
jgi:hypothetical protein